jgi:hypothetical protein
VEGAKFCDKINAIQGNLRFFKAKCDAAFLDQIKTGKRKDVSLGFFYDFDATPGKWNDQPYDFVQRNILVDHVAAGVPVGRCRSPYCGIAVDQLIRKVALDPEETENFVHIPVRDAGDFVQDSFRTIDIDADKGIKAVIGKLSSDPEGSTHIQKFLFDKSKDWTMEKAQAWIKEHKEAGDQENRGKGQPKSSGERLQNHLAKMSPADLAAKLVELFGDEVYKLLPDRGTGLEGSAAAEEMTLEDVKQKIMELARERDKLMDILYPKTPLSKEKQEELRGQLTVLDAQIRAFENILAEKIGSATDAEWTVEYINQLPDSCFAFIESGGKKDDEGKTVPRSLRHLPFKNAEGEIDHDHLVNALARVKQSATMPEGGKTAAIEKLCSAVRAWNREHPDSEIESEVCGTEASADACCEIERARRLLES